MGQGFCTKIAGAVLSLMLLASTSAAGLAAGGTKDPLAAADPAEADTARGVSIQAPAAREPAKPARKPAAKKPQRGALPFGITGTFDFQTIYDDNIFRYSPQNLLEFRQGLNPEKFKLDTYDDFILSPRIELSLDRRLFGLPTTNFRVRYTLWQYMSNPGKSNQAWMLRLRQPVAENTFLEFGYTYAPRAYIRELSDRAPFDPRTSTPLRWMEFNSLRHALMAAVQTRVTGRLTTRLEAGRVLRYYNRPFIENDNGEWNGTFSAQYALTKIWRLAGRYTYSDTRAQGYDTVGETRLASDDGDPSYKRDLYELGARFRPARAFWLFRESDALVQYQEYYYTSELPYYLDATHTGRKDEVWAGEATVTSAPLWRAMTLEAGYRHTERSSSSTASDVGAGSIEEDKNYHDNRVWLGMSYPF